MKTQLTEERVEPVACECYVTVPVSHLSLDLSEPIGGWMASLEGRGIEIVADDLGRRAIKRGDFAGLIAERNERERWHIEEQRRRNEEAAQKRKPAARGVPAQEGMSPFEAMVAADPNYQTAHDEFTGRERPTFLEDMLDEGKRALAAKKAKAEARRASEQEDLQ